MEELATLTEIQTDREGAAWMPELRGLRDRWWNSDLLYDAIILGNGYLAASLYIGNRLRMEAMNNYRAENHANTPYWQNDAWLKKYADWLLEVYTAGHAARWGIERDLARRAILPRVDWIRFARQLAFFMTPAYVDYVRPDAESRKPFPTKLIYGEGMVVNNSFRIEWPETFDNELGWIGYNGQKDQLSLGACNGQFPLREFERAFWGMALDWPDTEASTNDREEVETGGGEREDATPMGDPAEPLFMGSDEVREESAEPQIVPDEMVAEAPEAGEDESAPRHLADGRSIFHSPVRNRPLRTLAVVRPPMMTPVLRSLLLVR